ncbi:hypothetical protein BZG00_15965, partial [Salinivibrio kushneri]
DGVADSTAQTITITLNGANDTPVLNVVTSGSYTDTAANDTFSDITGTLSGSDRDSADTVSFELDGSSASSEVGFTVEKSSTYGTFYLNATSGAYKFVANDSAIEALKTTATATFDVNATDGVADSTAQTITITLNGANDTPVLNVVTSGSYT